MTSSGFTSGINSAASVPDVYTDLQGLQRLRNNKDKDEALKQVAEQFESMFLSLLLKNMRNANAVFEQDSLFNSNESNIARDMYDNQLTLNIAHGKGTGLAESLYRQMSGNYGRSVSESGAGLNTNSASFDVLRRLRQVNSGNANATSGAHAGSMKPTMDTTATQRAPLAETPADFVEQLLPHARIAAKKLGADANVLVAQAALETGWGKYVLADANGSSHNLFNIKANSGWQGNSVAVQAVEYRDGVAIREQSQFKKYDSVADSFDDFVALVQNSPRYADALRSATDAQDFVQSLHQAGYATDPDYAKKVMSVYRDIVDSNAGGGSTITPMMQVASGAQKHQG